MFGPDSVTWRVHADPLMFAAGIRALYLQALHPRAMWGVAQNRDFRSDAWGRLQRTADYVLTTTFGTPAQAEHAARHVRRVHARLCAHDPDTGREFRLDTPDLLRWVHCAEVDSYLSVVRRGSIRLTVVEADRYLDEQRLRAELIGLDTAAVPGTVAELSAYFAEMRPVLRATPESRAAVRFLLVPPMPRWIGVGPARIGFAGLSTLCFSALPGWARRIYGAPPVPGTELATSAWLVALRQTVGRVPARHEHPLLSAARKAREESRHVNS